MVFDQFQRVRDTGAVAILDVTADVGPHYSPNDRTHEDGNRSVLVIADPRPDGTAHHTAHDCAYRLIVAASRHDAVIVLPLVARIADVVGIVLLAPAVRWGPGRRAGHHPWGDEQGEL